MKLLAIDCAANLCAACVYDAAAGKELGRSVFDLGKGHAEHLMSVIDGALKSGATDYAGLGAIAVSTGPGSFTGLRVGVSAARGLALALKIPAIGVTTLEALAAQAAATFPGRAVLAALDAGREEIHAALYDELSVLRYGPAVTTLPAAAAMAADSLPVLAGTAAMQIAASVGRTFDIGPRAATADIAVYARLAAAKGAGEKPKPLYLRGADAKPQAGFILARQKNLMRIPFLQRRRRDYALEPLKIADSPAVSMLHQEDFVRPWTDGEFAALLEQDTVFGYAARETGQGGKPPVGFVLARLAAGEGEILTIAVARSHRRQGLGWQLMDAVLRELHAQRAEALFLEVDETNVAAIALYRRLGFREVGKRANYYRSPEHGPTGALVMRRDLR